MPSKVSQTRRLFGRETAYVLQYFLILERLSINTKETFKPMAPTSPDTFLRIQTSQLSDTCEGTTKLQGFGGVTSPSQTFWRVTWVYRKESSHLIWEGVDSEKIYSEPPTTPSLDRNSRERRSVILRFWQDPFSFLLVLGPRLDPRREKTVPTPWGRESRRVPRPLLGLHPSHTSGGQ